jgi:hypothetical protein
MRAYTSPVTAPAPSRSSLRSVRGSHGASAATTRCWCELRATVATFVMVATSVPHPWHSLLHRWHTRYGERMASCCSACASGGSCEGGACGTRPVAFAGLARFGGSPFGGSPFRASAGLAAAAPAAGHAARRSPRPAGAMPVDMSGWSAADQQAWREFAAQVDQNAAVNNTVVSPGTGPGGGTGGTAGGGPNFTGTDIASIITAGTRAVSTITNTVVQADAQRDLARIQAETQRRLLETTDPAARAALLAQLQQQVQQATANALSANSTGGVYRAVTAATGWDALSTGGKVGVVAVGAAVVAGVGYAIYAAMGGGAGRGRRRARRNPSPPPAANPSRRRRRRKGRRHPR